MKNIHGDCYGDMCGTMSRTAKMMSDYGKSLKRVQTPPNSPKRVLPRVKAPSTGRKSRMRMY